MKNLFYTILMVSILSCNETESPKQDQQNKTAQAGDTAQKSIPSETKKWVGNTDIKINYTAPAVRGRAIWGALVPYDKIWVTGAHNATTLEIGKEFKVGDKFIPAGRYALFTIPGKDEWIVIINKNWDQHQADEYSAAEDVQRIRVKPTQKEELAERLKYEVDQTGERNANIIMSWEKLSIRFPVEIR